MSNEFFKGRPPVLTREQRELLDSSSEYMTAAGWADKFKVHVSVIYSYCRNHGLHLMGSKEARERKQQRDASRVAQEMKKIRTYEPPVKKEKLIRPPARYDNRSQQDVINHYLKLEI